MRKPVVGVIGASEQDGLSESDNADIRILAERLGAAIARSDCILITGATTGLPHLVSKGCRSHGGLTLGVSPAANGAEHRKHYGLPAELADGIGYTALRLDA